MTKDILVSISGLQVSPEMESDTVEVISPGEYYYRNDKHFVVYEEAIDGKTETVKNMVKLSKDCVEVTKKGPARIHMIFEKNKKNIITGSFCLALRCTAGKCRGCDSHHRRECQTSFRLGGSAT